MRIQSFRAAVAVLAAAASVFAAATAYTVPRYSARYGQDCSLCHFNPAGGGERTVYATKYLVPEEMALHPPGADALAGIDPQISRTITAGVDLRTFFFQVNPNQFDRPDDFMQMQGNLYVNVQMSDRLAAVLSQGMTGEYEVFGLAYFLPFNGYLKAGRFTPQYGWRFDDHTAYVRERMGFIPPAHTDAGMELGIHPGAAVLTVSLLNGAPGSLQDFNQSMEVVGRAGYRFRVGKLGLALGGSALRNKDPQTDRLAGGPFAYLSAGRLVWVGEADFLRDRSPGVEPATSWFTSNELSFRIRQGVDAVATFDHYDPDKSADTGSQQRYGAGVQVMPYPFLILDGRVNYTRRTGAALAPGDYTQTVVQMHFFY